MPEKHGDDASLADRRLRVKWGNTEGLCPENAYSLAEAGGVIAIAQIEALASADSLLGQLQRGRGAGFRRALREDALVLHPLLVACVTHDPRWDRQVETRNNFYASLIVHSGLPLAPLDVYLRALAETDPDNPNDLVLGTLRALTARSYADSADILRAYLSYGQYWADALEAVAEAPGHPIDVRDADRLVDERCPDMEALGDELGWVDGQREPWSSLRAINLRVARIFAEQRQAAEERDRQQERMREACTPLTVPELLTIADDRNYRVVVAALQGRVSRADLGMLLDTAASGGRVTKAVAMRGLERLADPAALPILRSFFESPDDQWGRVYAAAVRAITALPSGATLDLGRAWFDAPDGAQRHVALRILEEHATVADIPRVRRALLPSLRRDTPETNECYLQCGMLDILARFPEAGPYPEATTVFEEAGYSWTRIYAARVLHASDQRRFAEGLALECLWDCEERVRLIGCESVDLRADGARARVEAMADDPYEEDRVRDKAAGRILSR